MKLEVRMNYSPEETDDLVQTVTSHKDKIKQSLFYRLTEAAIATILGSLLVSSGIPKEGFTKWATLFGIVVCFSAPIVLLLSPLKRLRIRW
jgi:hypothetical protein